MTLLRIGPMSCAKMSAAIYFLFGLVFAVVFVPFALLGSVAGLSSGDAEGMLGLAVGLGMVVGAPILYGIMGFLSGLVGAVVYNLLAPRIGGVELGFGSPAAPGAGEVAAGA